MTDYLLEYKMDLIAQLRDALKAVPNLVSAHLFGSQAQKVASEESDVDIALLFFRGQEPGKEQLIELREQVREQIRKEVDLVSLNSASPILGAQVYQHGLPIVIHFQRAYDEYLIALMTDYADLKWQRAPMEHAILNRKYYGRSGSSTS